MTAAILALLAAASAGPAASGAGGPRPIDSRADSRAALAVAGPSTLGGPADGVIDGVVAGTAEDLRAIDAVLGDSLSRQGLVLELRRAARIAPDDVTRAAPGRGGDPERVVARFSLDLTSLPLAKLYLTDADRRRVYVRWLSLGRGIDAVSTELLRFVIENSIEAIRAGREIGVSREEYETALGTTASDTTAPRTTRQGTDVLTQPEREPQTQPAAPTTESPRQPRGRRATPAGVSPDFVSPNFGVSAGYEGTLVKEGKIQQGPVVWSSIRLPRLWIGGCLLGRLPTTIGDPTAEARMSSVGVRLIAAVPVANGEGLSLSLGAGAGIDVSQIRPGASGPGLAPESPFWATTPFGRIMGAVEYIVGHVSVAAAVGVDFDLLGERYVVAETAAERAVFVPWRVRPVATLLLGLAR